MSLASQLAEFVSQARYQSLPTEAIAAAKVAVLDTLGVTLAGAREDSSRISADIARQEGAREECSILGHGFRSSAQQAAFVNGTSSHAEDFDHSFAVQGQPTAPILAATLATAEAIGATGADVLVAYVAGFEVAGKLALAMVGAPENGFHGAGFHANNSLGGLGATAACTRLLDLDEARVEMALGLAASMSCGLRANFGTMAKPMHVGLAARSGVLAANLAARGFTASSSVFEGTTGFLHAFYPGLGLDEQVVQELGRSYALVEQGVRIKRYPCGGLAHAAIDAMVDLKVAHGLTADTIDHIEVQLPLNAYRTLAFRTPADGLQGKFCVGYLMARAVIDGGITLDTFTDEAVRDPEILDLLDKVDVNVDPDLHGGSDGSRPATVIVTLRTGERHRLHRRFARGSTESPLTSSEQREKFRDCAAGTLGDSARELAIGQLEQLEAIEDIRPLMELLRAQDQTPSAEPSVAKAADQRELRQAR